MTNGQSPIKFRGELDDAKANIPFMTSQDVKAAAALAAENAKLIAKEKKESLTKQMQRLQEERRLKEGIDPVKDEEPHTATHRRHFSFGYITLQVLMAPFRTFWLYIIATLTQSQERYQRVNQHKKRTRQMRLVEPLMEFVSIAILIQDKPALQWVWQMVGMFFWPLIRVFGGGLLVDK